MKQHSCLFLFTSETPYEVFTAGLLELSVTWFSEIEKLIFTLQHIRIERERLLTKIAGINWENF